MPSLDERREVAARLREIAPGSDWPNMTAKACGLNPREMSNNFHEFTGELCDRLADLIEPEPEKTCHLFVQNKSYYLSCCGYWIDDSWYLFSPNYCPYCGAKVID